MADQVEEVKEKTDIVSVISERIELKKAGRNFKANCPFHSEKTPSFMVSPELQIYKCFGCSEAGDVFSFLEKYEGMEFYEALKYLADRAGVKLTPRSDVSGEKERQFILNKWASRFYQYVLFNHPSAKEALNYLTKARGLTAQTIKTFEIGYSPDLPNVFKKFFIDKKGYTNEVIEKVGLGYLRGSNLYDRFAGRIVFPLFDHRGNVAGFSGRILPGKERADVGKYINTPDTPIYHKSSILYGLNLTRKEIKDKGEAVIVEGELDAISPWQAGIKNIVAIKGSAFTQEQAKLISRFTQNIILALDTDIAGDAAARRGIEIAEQENLRIRVADLGNYKDPDEMAQKDPDALKAAIGKAFPVWDYLIDSTFSKFKEAGGETKAYLSRERVPILSKIKDEIVRAHYVKEVANRLDVPYEAVLKEIENTEVSNKNEVSPSLNMGSEKKEVRREILEEKLLSLAFLFGPKKYINKEFSQLIKSPLGTKLLDEYNNFSKKVKTFTISSFSVYLPEELKYGFSEMILKTSNEEPETDEKVKKEINLLKREIRILDIKEEQKDLAGKIRIFEKSQDISKLKSAEEKFDKLSKRLKVEKAFGYNN